MKKKLSTILLAALIITGIGVTTTSCGNDDRLTEMDVRRIVDQAIKDSNFQSTNWKILNVSSPVDAWDWNGLTDGSEGYWSTAVALEYMTDPIFRDGFTIPYFVFSGANKTIMPYLRTYSENGAKYTEYYSCEIIRGDNGKYEAIFTVETSDFKRKPSKEATFQLVTLW